MMPAPRDGSTHYQHSTTGSPRSRHPDADTKLKQARYQQQLATQYTQALRGRRRSGLGGGNRGIHSGRRGRRWLSRTSLSPRRNSVPKVDHSMRD